jgi:two-component system sensor histidine kinase BaeS
MFPSLKAKLTLAFALVTALTLLLSAVGTMWLLREREASAVRERVGQLSALVNEQTAAAAGLGWKEDALSALLHQRGEEVNLRFLLINTTKNNGRGEIVTDTADQLAGRSADEFINPRQRMRQSALAGFSFTGWQDNIVVYPGNRFGVRQRVAQDYLLLTLVPESTISRAWEGLLPRVALSGGVALVIAVCVAYVLSQSITRPVVSLTRASEEMARGNYDQQIEVEGRDEIGRLARSFNFMADQVSRTHQAMRDLNGNVAHELKTPLTSIQGYSQAMLDGILHTPEESAHAAHVINDEADRMRRLVEDLLYLSRLESGQLQIERASIHVPTLLRTAAERVEWQLRHSGRELDVRMAIDIPPISGDQRRLEQVFANLLDNAVRYTPAGGRITLSSRWSLDSVTITVHNTGSYIPPEHLSRIFERFYQVDASRARDGHHGGLGLAIAREIVVAHGGSLTATSEPDTGTEFRVMLPTSQRTAAESARLPAPAASTPLPPPAGRDEPAA